MSPHARHAGLLPRLLAAWPWLHSATRAPALRPAAIIWPPLDHEASRAEGQGDENRSPRHRATTKGWFSSPPCSPVSPHRYRQRHTRRLREADRRAEDANGRHSPALRRAGRLWSNLASPRESAFSARHGSGSLDSPDLRVHRTGSLVDRIPPLRALGLPPGFRRHHRRGRQARAARAARVPATPHQSRQTNRAGQLKMIDGGSMALVHRRRPMPGVAMAAVLDPHRQPVPMRNRITNRVRNRPHARGKSPSTSVHLRDAGGVTLHHRPRGQVPLSRQRHPPRVEGLEPKTTAPPDFHPAGLIKSAMTYFPAVQYHRRQELNF